MDKKLVNAFHFATNHLFILKIKDPVPLQSFFTPKLAKTILNDLPAPVRIHKISILTHGHRLKEHLKITGQLLILSEVCHDPALQLSFQIDTARKKGGLFPSFISYEMGTPFEKDLLSLPEFCTQ